MPSQEFKQEVQPELQQAFQQASQQALWQSDIRYFQAAAENKNILGGQLSYMEDLSSQAGACVFHSLDVLPQRDLAWLNTLEGLFLKKAVKRSRLYLQKHKPEDEAFLTQNGYRAVIEIGMAGRVDLQILHAKNIKPVQLVAIHEALWPLHQRLLSSSEAAPDGHRMQATDYALLEKRKVEAGYMQMFLYIENGEALAVASLDIKNGFARIKNLLVHPEQRGKGLGKRLIAGLLTIAQQQGAQAMGAYALAENKAAYGMYQALGMQKIYQQYEWLRQL